MENKVSIHRMNLNINKSFSVDIGNILVNQPNTQEIGEIIDKANKLSSSGLVPEEEKQRLNKSIQSLENASQNNSLSNKTIQEALKTIRNVAEGIAGSTLATGLLNIIGNFI